MFNRRLAGSDSDYAVNASKVRTEGICLTVENSTTKNQVRKAGEFWVRFHSEIQRNFKIELCISDIHRNKENRL